MRARVSSSGRTEACRLQCCCGGVGTHNPAKHWLGEMQSAADWQGKAHLPYCMLQWCVPHGTSFSRTTLTHLLLLHSVSLEQKQPPGVVHWLLYALVAFVFVYPLWTVVATAFSKQQAKLGALMNVPHGITNTGKEDLTFYWVKWIGKASGGGR